MNTQTERVAVKPLSDYPIPIINRTVAIMRCADAYAWDAGGRDKMVPARFVLEREIAASLAQGDAQAERRDAAFVPKGLVCTCVPQSVVRHSVGCPSIRAAITSKGEKE